jgi:hypothetical protein
MNSKEIAAFKKIEVSEHLFPCLANIVLEYSEDPRLYGVIVNTQYQYKTAPAYARFIHDPFHDFITNGFTDKIMKKYRFNPYGFSDGASCNQHECWANFKTEIRDLSHDEMLTLVKRKHIGEKPNCEYEATFQVYQIKDT